MSSETTAQPVKRSRALAGTLLVLFGVAALLNSLNLAGPTSLEPLWPAVFGLVIYLFSSRGRFMTIVSLGFILSGVLGQLNAWDLLPANSGDLFWPLMIIAVGGLIIWPHPNAKRRPDSIDSTTSDSSIEVTAVFGGQVRRVRSKSFTGGEGTAVFGSLKIDLSEATMASGATLKIESIFGGAEIVVPEDCEVEVDGTPLFGGVDDKTKKGGKQHLKIDATAVFGGVTVTN